MNTMIIATLVGFFSPACHSTGATTMEGNRRDSIARFVHVLKSGGSLFGLGAGCDEWRAKPMLAGEDRCDQSPCVSGRLESEVEQGKIYGFSYTTTWAMDPVEITMRGRGSWHPAPGFTFTSEEPIAPGYGILGSARMCVERVAVRSNDMVGDAVSIGSDTWYLTKETCLRIRGSAGIARECGAASH